MVVAHELSHQWFGDLVTPAWWDDIWLNESFANWMGYRIGNEWRPELKIGVGALDEGFGAMNTDALLVGRPIHQPINENSEIDSAFDNITYGKGGQVVAMIAAYLGDEKFKDGVRLHLKRHAYGNATSEQFFQSIADAAQGPRSARRVQELRRPAGRAAGDAAPRRFAGWSRPSRATPSSARRPPAQSWTIPFCIRAGEAKNCIAARQGRRPTFDAPGSGALVPNVGGTGYYRFDLPPADWNALIADSAALPPGEAIATTDSLWASFRAGRAPAALLVDGGQGDGRQSELDRQRRSRASGLPGLAARGMVPASAMPAYRKLIESIYAPRLKAIGFDPSFGAHHADTPEQQQLRQQLVGLVGGQAKDAAVRAKLKAAADTLSSPGTPRRSIRATAALRCRLPLRTAGCRRPRSWSKWAFQAKTRASARQRSARRRRRGTVAAAAYLLNLSDKRLRSYDRLGLVGGLVGNDKTSAYTADWILANYDKLASGNGIFFGSRLPSMLGGQCSAAAADRIEKDAWAEGREGQCRRARVPAHASSASAIAASSRRPRRRRSARRSAAQMIGRAQSTPRMKAPTRVLNSAGRSRLPRCPAPSTARPGPGDRSRQLARQGGGRHLVLATA